MATLNPLNAATSFNEYDLDEDGEPVTAVPQRVQAVAVPQRAQFASNNPLADLENAVPFSYSDGTSMVADKGGWQVRSKKTVSVGNAIILEIESWERLWMVTPGTDKAPKECVAYSRDGVNCNNPEQGTLQEHLAMLKASNYPNAKLEERVIVFGFYEGSERPFPSDMETPEYVQPFTLTFVYWKVLFAVAASLLKKQSLLSSLLVLLKARKPVRLTLRCRWPALTKRQQLLDNC
jgi:hypothetical protein